MATAAQIIAERSQPGGINTHKSDKLAKNWQFCSRSVHSLDSTLVNDSDLPILCNTFRENISSF